MFGTQLRPFPRTQNSNSKTIRAAIHKDSKRFAKQPGQSQLATESTNAIIDDSVKLFREWPPGRRRTRLKEYAQELNTGLTEAEDWLTQHDPLGCNGTDAPRQDWRDALTMRYPASWNVPDPQGFRNLMFFTFRADMSYGRLADSVTQNAARTHTAGSGPMAMWSDMLDAATRVKAFGPFKHRPHQYRQNPEL